jgi:hypothetical protein
MYILPNAGNRSLDVGTLYAVEFNCGTPRDDGAKIHPLPTNNGDTGIRQALFPSNKKNIAHFLSVTTNPNATLDSATALALVYSMDDKGDYVQHTEASCARGKLVYGPANKYLMAVTAYSEKAVPNVFDTVFSKLTTLISAAAPLVTGKALPAGAVATLTAADATAKAVSDLANQLNVDAASTTPKAVPLVLGKTYVDTDYSHVVVSVRPIRVVLNDDNGDFVADLAAAGTGQTTATISPTSDAATATTITAAELQSRCQLVASALQGQGFIAPEDQLYALTSAAIGKLGKKEDLIFCLQRTLATLAADLFRRSADPNDREARRYSLLVQSGMRFDQDDVDRLIPPNPNPQPAWIVAKGPIQRLTHLLGTYVQGGSMDPDLINVMTPTVSAKDPENTLPTPTPSTPAELFGAIRRAGYQHIGCWEQADDDVLSEYGAVGELLAIKAPAAAREAKLSAAVVVLPIFKGLKITLLEFTADNDLRTKIAQDHNNKCNGFPLKDDRQPDAPPKRPTPTRKPVTATAGGPAQPRQ